MPKCIKLLCASRSKDCTGSDVSDDVLVKEQISVYVCFPVSAQEAGHPESFAGYSLNMFHFTHLHPPLIFGRMDTSIVFCFKLKRCAEVFAHGSPISFRDYSVTLKGHLN